MDLSYSGIQGAYDARMPVEMPGEDSAHDAAIDAFFRALESSADAMLKLDTRQPRYHSVSQLMAAAISDGGPLAELLREACLVATDESGAPETQRVRDARAGTLLRQWVQDVANWYADDNQGAY